MKVKRKGITDVLRRIWLFSANKIKSSESVSKQPTQLIFQLNSSLRQKLGTLVLQQTFKLSPGFKSVHAKFVTSTLEPIICSPETSLQFIWSNFATAIISRLLKNKVFVFKNQYTGIWNVKLSGKLPHIWLRSCQSHHQSVQVCLVLREFRMDFQEWKRPRIPKVRKHPQHWQRWPEIRISIFAKVCPF